MSTPVLLPQIGESMVEATIGLWLKRPGESIRRFEPLVQIETEKVITEVPSPLEGVVREIVAREGDTVKIGEPIALIEEDSAASGEPAQAPAAAAHAPEPGGPLSAAFPQGAAAAQPGVTPAPAPGAAAAPAGPLAPAAASDTPTPAPGGLFPSSPLPAAAAAPGAPMPLAARTAEAVAAYSPAVRRLAVEYGLDPRAVQGTGAGGRVTREDVVAHAQRRRAADAPGPAEEEVVAPSPMRRAIAQRMLESVRGIPHAWMMVEADVTGLVRLRQAVRAEFQQREGFDLTYFPFFVKAVVEALRAQPSLNASWTDAGIVQHRRINLSIAVAAEDGLVVPVLRGADGMSVAGIARAVRVLAERARAGDLAPEEMRDGTFTVNNTGTLGSVVSMPIINAPQSGIVTLETIRTEPAVVGEGIAIRQRVHLCLSFDHRVADGLAAGRFMGQIRRVMEAYAPGDAVY